MVQVTAPNFTGIKKLIFFFVGFIIIVNFLSSIFISVPPGFVGAVYDRGRGVLPKPLHEGLNFMIPYWQSVTLFDTRINDYTMSVVPDEGALRRDDSLDAPTSDGQQVKVDASILFRVVPDEVPALWREIGEDYVDKLIRPVGRSQIRMVISRYSAPAIYSEKRQEAEQTMTDEIRALLAPKHIYIDRVLLRAVYFSPEYSKAIEDKVIAEQRVKQAEFEVQQASQTAQAKIAEAKGLAEAQVLQKQSLTSEYLQLEAIKKWDGKLPSVVGNGSTPFINIPLK